MIVVYIESLVHIRITYLIRIISIESISLTFSLIQMNPAWLVEFRDLTGGTKYLILSITLIHGGSSLVHLEGPEGDHVYRMLPVCTWIPKTSTV